MPIPLIRKFRARDERAVRMICFETALFGESVAPYFGDLRLVTDAILGFHIWGEPDYLYVADADGRVVGYLAGTMDVRSLRRRCAARLAFRLSRGWVARGHFLRPRSWRLAWDAARYARAVASLSGRVRENYPANLHVNIDRNYRALGLGRALVEKFLEDAGRGGSPGVHLATTSAGGREFFSAMGFAVAATAASPSIAGRSRDIFLMTRALP